MTEKPRERLNLIERAAKRLSEEESVAPDVHRAGASLVERAALRAAQDARDATAEQLNARSHDHATALGAVTDAPVPPARPDGDFGSTATKQVNLNFQELRQNGMITPDNMGSVISNEFRGIKRRLLQKVRDPHTRAAINNLIMVTSSLPGEGKTFCSVNLAVSLAAERGLNVLLIDADVIRPSIGKMFVSPPREGLTDLLAGKQKKVSDVLHRCTEIPNLSIIFAGAPVNNSPELISSGRMAAFCREFSAGYTDRVIVIDTPPVLAAPESAILASYVHQLLMVVAADHTDKHQLRTALEAVSSCQNVSLLFNKAPSWNEVEYAGYYGYTSPPSSSAPAPEAV